MEYGESVDAGKTFYVNEKLREGFLSICNRFIMNKIKSYARDVPANIPAGKRRLGWFAGCNRMGYCGDG